MVTERKNTMENMNKNKKTILTLELIGIDGFS